jgi:hypothetical protein
MLKRTYLTLLLALVSTASGTGATRAIAASNFHSPLVTSTTAAELGRTAGELAPASVGVALLDGTGTISDGFVEIGNGGTVKLTLQGVNGGSSGFLLLNQGDHDGDGDRDYVFAGSFVVSSGAVNVEFPGALPPGNTIEDLLVTVVLDDGDSSLTGNDGLLAVPGFTPVADADGDGVPDGEDDCLDSDLSPKVVIDGCDTGVTNQVLEAGCTMSDHIAQCADGVTNHGQFVSCVAHLRIEFWRAGLISGKQTGKIQSCAARSAIP